MWSTIGHEHVKSILDKQLLSGQFPHAYFFSGPEGVGKKTLALEFAKKVLAAGELSNHPDFLLLDQDGEITVDSVHEFMARLRFKPFMGKWKVAIINNAEQLNTQSGNALLKTLEEPSASAIVILIAANAFLLPTIVSRCQTFAFHALSGQQLNAFAAQRKYSIVPEMVAASFGRPSRLAEFSSRPEAYEKQREDIRLLGELRAQAPAERLLRIPELAELETADLKNLFSTWLLAAKQQLAGRPQGYAGVQNLLSAFNELNTNKNKKLILQGLLLAL